MIDDSIRGIRSARAAGMLSIALSMSTTAMPTDAVLAAGRR
jgi:beta-phosphoglucomutase-like phosphatase (HAD superfamily)